MPGGTLVPTGGLVARSPYQPATNRQIPASFNQNRASCTPADGLSSRSPAPQLLEAQVTHVTWRARIPARWAPLLGLLTATAASAQQHAVTLADAVALAAKQDPAVIQAQGTVRSTGAGVRSAKGAYLPSLSANGSGGSSFSAGPPAPTPSPARWCRATPRARP